MMAGAGYQNVIAALITIAREEGVSALFNGLLFSLTKQGPAVAITMAAFEVGSGGPSGGTAMCQAVCRCAPDPHQPPLPGERQATCQAQPRQRPSLGCASPALAARHAAHMSPSLHVLLLQMAKHFLEV